MTLPIGRRPNRCIFIRASRSKAGYTLIELILLSIIILAIIAVSTPQFKKTFSDLELRDASFNIARLINFIQEKAILEGVPYKLRLDTQENRYYFTKLDPELSNKYVRLKERVGRIFVLPRDIKLNSDNTEIVFYPDGHSDKASIIFKGRYRSSKIVLKGNLGYVEVD